MELMFWRGTDNVEVNRGRRNVSILVRAPKDINRMREVG